MRTGIDTMINSQIPLMVSRLRQKGVKDLLQFKNKDDFLYGAAYGAIVYGYIQLFFALFNRVATEEEGFEMRDIITRRMREVKDAIFKTG